MIFQILITRPSGEIYINLHIKLNFKELSSRFKFQKKRERVLFCPFVSPRLALQECNSGQACRSIYNADLIKSGWDIFAYDKIPKGKKCDNLKTTSLDPNLSFVNLDIVHGTLSPIKGQPHIAEKSNCLNVHMQQIKYNGIVWVGPCDNIFTAKFSRIYVSYNNKVVSLSVPYPNYQFAHVK